MSGRAHPRRRLAALADDEPGEPAGRRGAALDAAEPPADPEAAARQICLRLLTVAPRTRAQLADAMRRRGVPQVAADAVLDRFTDARLIDDAAFARAWVESRHHSRGLSRRALAAELRHRGVADDDVRDATGLLDPDQEVATARRLVARRLAATRGQPLPTRVRRVAGMLARKGYPSGLVFRLIREALESETVADHDATPTPSDDPGDIGPSEYEAPARGEAPVRGEPASDAGLAELTEFLEYEATETTADTAAVFAESDEAR